MNELVVQPKTAIRAGNSPRAIVPADFDGCWRIATAVMKAGMAPKSLKSAEACTIAIMHGLEVGFAPMQALQSIAVINGRPTIWGDGAIGLVRGSGHFEEIKEWMDGQGDALTAFCKVKRRGEPWSTVYSFSVAQAKKAGLWSKEGPWQTYPERMLAVRPRSWALRDVFADVLKGLGIAEEVMDTQREAQRIDAPPPPPAIEAVVEEAEQEAIEEVFAPGAATVTEFVAEKAAQRANVPPPPPDETDNTDETVEELFARADKWGASIAKGDTDALETYLDDFGQLLDGLFPPDRAHLQSIIDRHRQRVEPANTMAG